MTEYSTEEAVDIFQAAASEVSTTITLTGAELIDIVSSLDYGSTFGVIQNESTVEKIYNATQELDPLVLAAIPLEVANIIRGLLEDEELGNFL